MVNNQELITFQECCKWSAQNPGKTPDPWYKLKFRPKPVKPKPVKEKKEKKEKELTKKQKEKLEKVKVLFSYIAIFTSIWVIKTVTKTIIQTQILIFFHLCDRIRSMHSYGSLKNVCDFSKVGG